MNDFNQFQSFFEYLTNSIQTASFNLLPDIIHCFNFASNSQLDKDFVFIVFQYLFEFLSTFLNNSNENKEFKNEDIIESLCLVLSSIIENLDERISPFSLQIMEMMIKVYNNYSFSTSLIVIANLSVPNPQFISEQLSNIIPIIIDAQKHYSEPRILIPSVELIPKLMEHVNITPYFQIIIDNLFQTLELSRDKLQSKTVIIDALTKIMKSFPDLFKNYIPLLYSCLVYITKNLEIVYKIYYEVTNELVLSVCNCILNLLDFCNQKEIEYLFKLFFKLINKCVKFNGILDSSTDILFQILNKLLKLCPQEASREIVQNPNLRETFKQALLRSGVKIEEIDQINLSFNEELTSKI